MKHIRGLIPIVLILLTSISVSANLNQPTKVTKDSFSITLPGTLTHAAPEIDTQQNLKIYSYTDSSTSPQQVMSVMVVNVDPKTMGADLEKAAKNFALGILIGYSKRDAHPMSFQAAEQSIQPTQINNRLFQFAELKMQNGVLNIYVTYTQTKIYGLVFSSRNEEGVTEMRAALSNLQLIS